jgi:hypothetical protein
MREKAFLFWLMLFSFFLLEGYTSLVFPEMILKRQKKPEGFLQEICQEVREMGSYPNENFIKREFHINLDGREENREEHVVVLIYPWEDREKMTVQVTYYEPLPHKRYIKVAKQIRSIYCCFSIGWFEIENSDYSPDEMKSLLPSILKGIRSKKKWMRLQGDDW